MGKVAVCVCVCELVHTTAVCACVGGSVKRINQWDKSSIGTGSRSNKRLRQRTQLNLALLHAQFCVARKCVLRLSPVSYVPSVDPNRCLYAVTAASTYSKPQDLPSPPHAPLASSSAHCKLWVSQLNCANSWLLCCSLLLLLHCCCFCCCFCVTAKHKP